MSRLVVNHVRLISIENADSVGPISLSKRHVHSLPPANLEAAAKENEVANPAPRVATQAPTCIALSYVWGEEQEHILCDGAKVDVTSNLVAAFRQLQQHFPGQLFWTAILSIDQEDDAEKSQQVSMMGRNFAAADTVVVWLGDGTEDLYRGLRDSDLLKSKDQDVSSSERRIKLIRRIAQNPWFYRV